MQAKHKVIFDTDPGVDDAMALYFALAHPDIEVVGITTTFGNVHVEQATINALYLTRIAGRTIPVAQGVAIPFAKAAGSPPDFIHGADGLGNLPQRIDVGGTAEAHSAAEFIVAMARQYPGEISLVAVGPLGNLGLALKLEPRLPQLLKQVVLMAGTVDEPGNVSPVAEANVWNDPDAADLVFTAGWDLTMVGLDVTHRVVLPASFFAALAKQHNHIAMDTLAHAVNFYASFYQSIRPDLGHACYGHDVLAFVWLVAPEMFGTASGRVRVATAGIGNGQTMLAKLPIPYPQAGWEADKAETRVCMTVDAAACARLIDRTLAADWLRAPLSA
ncbi:MULTISPECIES: nucleoside hydrolase [unclassified Undibacterium]|uniref:nucleoside hydrolase n=1 Tax=unclassified Undibacterium TaxID=2630295 RepID=UPI002AC96398|nr:MULTISPECIES: nucleoside hydrolase [unclassified Undibacterium]MEB0140461.1 nucleoside hydrolase [Undibacterium sp. CCC2.1]MEB0173530.1 nucleoside hydrolase [Undibacterium sp. CCC1.1]MEB0177456.1 nucleoside hydrolase [Undibacterium sp. CCC3.4]MEB0214354.1 nucleoside hydrolase [Undibacterium sp. 5I2]WPX44224.1 nucleoside hydrolase [Undibacterium sp. CCC3.4]